MTTATAALPERLDAAITNLSQRQKDRLTADLHARGLEAAGLRGMIAVLAGLPTTSVLSDMTAGRTPGQRHQEALARVLGVSREWLAGDDRHCPDWTLEPLAAWERFAEQLSERWRSLAGRKA